MPVDQQADVLRGFACPQGDLDENVFRLLVNEHARQSIRLFLDRYASALATSSGIADQLRSTGPGIAWDPVYSDVWSAIHATTDDAQVRPRNVAAAIALHLGSTGVAGEWRITADIPFRPRWGRWMFPECAELSVESTGDCATVGVDGRPFRFTRVDGGWWCDTAERLPAFGEILLLDRDTATDPEFDGMRALLVERAGDREVERFRGSFALLDRVAPAYVGWITRTLRQIVLLRADDGIMRSGSLARHFGLVHMSCWADPVVLAEMMVHEATHQYFHILERLGPVHDGSDATLYYSPAKGTRRPVDRILLAYHAFGNVLLLYRLCHEAGVGDWRRALPELTDHVRRLEAPLRGNPALTVTGRALCEPLMAQLRLDG